MATGKQIKVWFEDDNGVVYEITAHAASISYTRKSTYSFFEPKDILLGEFTCSFIGEPKVVRKAESIVETYFDEQVNFYYEDKVTTCYLMDGISGTASCNPQDEYNKDFGKLLAYQRAKDKQLYGK